MLVPGRYGAVMPELVMKIMWYGNKLFYDNMIEGICFLSVGFGTLLDDILLVCTGMFRASEAGQVKWGTPGHKKAASPPLFPAGQCDVMHR